MPSNNTQISGRYVPNNNTEHEMNRTPSSVNYQSEGSKVMIMQNSAPRDVSNEYKFIDHPSSKVFTKKLNQDEFGIHVSGENVVRVRELKTDNENITRRVVNGSNYRTNPGSTVRSESNIVSSHIRPPVPQSFNSSSNLLKTHQITDNIMTQIDKKFESDLSNSYRNGSFVKEVRPSYESNNYKNGSVKREVRPSYEMNDPIHSPGSKNSLNRIRRNFSDRNLSKYIFYK